MAALAGERKSDKSDLYVKHAEGRQFQVFQKHIII
jgi:hypothetical protein